ncbi:MAG: heme exporter protein CcmD [Caulobacterales bacterium]|nr:heme exporter protein CcmD [Caulobacterales bacterium]
MSAFFEMGGYAAYVWSAYGLALVVVGGLAAATIARCARERRRLKRLEGEGAP